MSGELERTMKLKYCMYCEHFNIDETAVCKKCKWWDGGSNLKDLWVSDGRMQVTEERPE